MLVWIAILTVPACNRPAIPPSTAQPVTEEPAAADEAASATEPSAESAAEPISPELPVSDETAAGAADVKHSAEPENTAAAGGGDHPEITAVSSPVALEPGRTDAASASVGMADQGGEADSESATNERFILYASGGPLVIDVQLSIGGDSLDKGLEDLVDRALAAADVDGDGEATWSEVIESDRFRYGQFGNLPFDDDEEKAMLVRIYDKDGDGIVARAELPRFVTRNAGSARSFSMTSSNQYRSGSRANSPLRRILDADGSGAISETEIEAATELLLKLDANDDEILSRQEVAEDDDLMPGRLSNMRRRNQPDTALLIGDKVDWRAVRYVLSELYAYEGELQPTDWPGTPQLFAALDGDSDGDLTAHELKALADVPAHVVLQIRFGDDAEDSTGPSIEFVSLHADLESRIVSTHRYPGRCSISLPDAEIEFFVNEDGSLARSQQVGERQLNMFDGDKNGYLDEDEFPENLPGTQAPFTALDEDGDGKLYLAELVEFLDLRQAAFRGQVRARTADQPDSTFTALDTDGDGSLKTREIFQAPRRLRELDQNGDGQVHGHEIPGTMVVGFVRGNPQADDNLLVVPTRMQSGEEADDKTPRWFRGMDANGDQEISAREFLGSAERFSEFDTDSDGFLSIAECTAGEGENRDRLAGQPGTEG